MLRIHLLRIYLQELIFSLQAFGIGALEEDEDEDNVYGVESMTSYHSTLAGEGDISMERKYGWTGGHESGEMYKINILERIQKEYSALY